MSNLHTPANQEQTNQSVSAQTGVLSTTSQGASLTAPAYQLQQEDTTPHVGNAQQRMMSVQYNLIGHGFAYSTNLDKTQGELAETMGFENQWKRVIDDNDVTGFFAGLLLPKGFQNNHNLDEFSLEADSESTSNSDVPPVMAFRGSEKSSLAQFKLDWYNNDMDPIAVGYTAFMLNYEDIQVALRDAVELTGKRVVVTGHSLGGSLAKQAALHFPHLISACYTYQAPGISGEQQKYLEENMNSQGNINGDQMSAKERGILSSRFDDVDTHGFDDIYFEAHTAEGDIVNYAGDGRIPGSKRIKHDPSGINGLTPLAHTLMVTSSNEYSTEHSSLIQRRSELFPNQLNTTSDLYTSSIPANEDGTRTPVTPMDIDSKASNTNDRIHESVEVVRDEIIAEMFNPHAELITQFERKDESFKHRLKTMPLASKKIILNSLLNGPGIIESLSKGAGIGLTPLGPGAGLLYSLFALSNDINQTQEAAYTILFLGTKPNEQIEMIKHMGGATIFYNKMDSLGNNFFGSNVFDNTRNNMIIDGGYFSSLSASEGKEEIEKNLEGGFLGFGDDTQEKLIADVLVYGLVGNDILRELGEGDYNEGLKIVLKKLQGKEDKIVSDKFKFTDGTSRWFW